MTAESPNQRIPMREVLQADFDNFGIVRPEVTGPVLRGADDTDYTCPACGAVLLQRMKRGHVIGVAVQCFQCGTVSAPPDQV